MVHTAPPPGPYSHAQPAPHRLRQSSGTAPIIRRAAEGAPVSPALVAAVVPEQILHEDEVVLILTKPSLFFILFTSVRFILVAVMAGILTVRISQASDIVRQNLPWITPSAVALATSVVCTGRLVWALMVWTSHIYMLTNQRIVTIKGVVNVHMFQAQLRKIQRVELFKPLLLRVFGMGTLGFATAATTTLDSTWVMIARPLETQEQISAAIHKSQGHG